MQLTGWENANNMRNARAHKLQWSGSTVHSSTVDGDVSTAKIAGYPLSKIKAMSFKTIKTDNE